MEVLEKMADVACGLEAISAARKGAFFVLYHAPLLLVD
jgi:hypothetical protein